jgi:hypothetical protein
MVPASMLIYGSILIAVTRQPHDLSSTPMDDAARPLPMPDITPPDTTTYLHFLSASSDIDAEMDADMTRWRG